MRKVKWEKVSIGEKKIYSLAYADDLALMAEGKDEMRSMMERLKGYRDGKKLEVNTEKTKVMRFRKGRERQIRRDWRWKGRKIEEVKEYRYVGYMLSEERGTRGTNKG